MKRNKILVDVIDTKPNSDISEIKNNLLDVPYKSTGRNSSSWEILALNDANVRKSSAIDIISHLSNDLVFNMRLIMDVKIDQYMRIID